MIKDRSKLILLICALTFAATIWGSVDCGARLTDETLSPEETDKLRHLIYFHFALAQVAVIAAVITQFRRQHRWRRYYLLVSYNEKGLHLNPPGIRMPAERVYRCHLGNIRTAELPPTDAPILVYPMFMLSGHSSGTKLEAELNRAYAARHETPDLYYQPVLGASPWLSKAAAAHIKPMLNENTGVLVVAHGSRLTDSPPEPALFCRRLRELLPGTEIALGYFSQEPNCMQALEQMQTKHVIMLPFLLTEGLHTARDLPTAEHAAACDKSLTQLPVVAALLQ